MSHQPSLPHGVMEGQGAYNKHAKLPAAGGSLALPLWEKVVEGAEVDPGDRTVVVADSIPIRFQTLDLLPKPGMQSLTKPQRQLKHPVIRGQNQNIPRRIQYRRTDLAMRQMLLHLLQH